MYYKLLITISLTLSIVFFALGLFYPILSTKHSILGIGLKFQEVRLIDSVKMFYKSGDYVLAGVIFMFTIIIPVIKFFEIINRFFQIKKLPEKLTKVLQAIDKWSMLDVFLVALLLLNFKMDSNIIVMKLKIGTTYIALSIIMRMLSSHLTDKYIINLKEQNND